MVINCITLINTKLTFTGLHTAAHIGHLSVCNRSVKIKTAAAPLLQLLILDLKVFFNAGLKVYTLLKHVSEHMFYSLHVIFGNFIFHETNVENNKQTEGQIPF